MASSSTPIPKDSRSAISAFMHGSKVSIPGIVAGVDSSSVAWTVAAEGRNNARQSRMAYTLFIIKLLFFFCTGKRPSPVANLLTHLVYDSKTQLSTITLAISHNYLGEILCLIISFAHNAWAGAWYAWKTEVNFLLPQCIVTTIFYYMFSAPL